MTLGDIPHLMGPYLFVQIVAAVAGLLAAVVVALRLVQGKPTHGALLALPALLPTAAVLLCVALGQGASDPRAGIALVVGSRLLGWLWLMPAVAATLIAAAVAGLRAEDKRWASAGAVLVLALLVVALPWGYGLPEEDYWPVALRTVVYAAAGLVATLAFAGRHERAGGDAAVAASAAFAVIVAGGEMLQRALGEAGLLDSIPLAEWVPEYVDAANQAVFFRLSPWNHLTMLVALAPLGLAIALASSEARGRAITAAVVLLAPLLYLYGNLGVEALQAIAPLPD